MSSLAYVLGTVGRLKSDVKGRGRTATKRNSSGRTALVGLEALETRILLARGGVTTHNDRPVPVTVSGLTPGSPVEFSFFPESSVDPRVEFFAKTTGSVNVVPLRGNSVVADQQGNATFRVQPASAAGWYTGFAFTPRVDGEFAVSQFSMDFGGPATCGPCPEDESDPSDTGQNSVQLFAGEKRLDETLLTIPGRGFDFAVQATYRSQVSNLRDDATGDFGVDWAFSYSDDRLIPDGEHVVLFSPELRTDMFLAPDPPGPLVAPREFYSQMSLNAAGDFQLRHADGMVKTYRRFDDPDIPGRLVKMEDRNDNKMTFHYARIDPNQVQVGDEKFVLAYVIDTMGREIRYQYYAQTQQTVQGRPLTLTHPSNIEGAFGRLARVIDFKGDMDFDGNARSADFPGQTNNRTLTFDYDDEGNLIASTTPAVSGTPHGNDFPRGKTTRFDYLRQSDIPASITGLERERLLHNLIAVQAPNETAVDPDNRNLINPREIVTYGTDPNDPVSFDRALTYTVGGTNTSSVPAGGTITYSYEIVSPSAATTNDSFLEIQVTDRRGNQSLYRYSAFDTMVERWDRTRGFHALEPAVFAFLHQYNDDKRRLQTELPEHNTIDTTFDGLNPDRFQQGNRLRLVQTPDEVRRGDQAKISVETVYEPIYQQPAAVTDPRGLDASFVPPIADPSGRTQRERYTTRYFFDYQESAELAASAPNDRLDIDGTGGRVNQSPLIAGDTSVLTTEVWLVQELGLPEDAGGLAMLRGRLANSQLSLALGDLNADGDTSPHISGDVVRDVQPPVVLLAGSSQAAIEQDRLQDIVSLYRHNRFGQMTSMVDPEGNVHTLEYFPESDPDGDGMNTPAPADGRTLDTTTGGYLVRDIRDTRLDPMRNNRTNPAPVNIRSAYTYDDVGNITSTTDGRGIVTEYFVNELNQDVQIVRAAAHNAFTPDPVEPMPLTDFQYVERTFYDANNNIVRTQIEDRGNTSNVGILGDVNGDNKLTSKDIDALFAKIGDPPDERCDLNSDGVVDEQDVEFLVRRVLGTELGDANLDRKISNADFGLVLGNFDEPEVGWGGGNVNGDDKVSNADFGIVLGGFGFVAANVPSPLALVDYSYQYDILDNLLQDTSEVSTEERLVTRYRYDSNENQVLTILPEGNAASAIYDERDLLLQSTRGALAAPTEAHLSATDPVNYDVRGGVLCQCTTYHYDDNGNVTETVDASDTDGSLNNNSERGGPGDRSRYIYDGFDRLTSQIDSIGNQTVSQYDPAGNVVRVSSFGPVAGPSPTFDGPDRLVGPVSVNGLFQSGNLVNQNLLSSTEFQYDELNRGIQTDQVLFVNTINTVRAADVNDGATDLGKGDLTPGDNQPIPGVVGIAIIGRVSARTEYDRKSRVTFTVEDDEDTYRTDYDGADRVAKTIDPEGNIVEYAYDDNHNVIETREIDVAQVAGVADEVFLTTNFYDILNRLQQTTDNLGQTNSYRYDSRDNLVATADSQGPVAGARVSRRAFSDGPRTENAVNDFGNVTRYFYDGISRETRHEMILTELPAQDTGTASGDGIHIGASIFGVKDDPSAPESFTPIPDTRQAGGDGIIRIGTTYDDNSLTSALIDDNGNITLYLYDNLNRRITETKGLVRSSPLTETFILGQRRVVTPTPATINDPAFIAEAQIQTQLDAAKARIDAIAALFPPLADDVTDPPPPPQATTIVYGYDPDDNVLILEDENDSEVFTRYDAINRALAVRVFRSEGNPTSRAPDSHVGDPIFAPDPIDDFRGTPRGPFPAIVGTHKQDYQYDGLSRLVRAGDNNEPADTADDSVFTYAYDSLSRVIEETQRTGALVPKAISSAWRAENLRSSLSYPNGRQLDYTYDDLDRLNTIADTGAALPIADYDYIGTYRVLVRAYPQNGTRMTYLDDTGTTDAGYDGLRRPIQLRHLRTDNSLIVGFTHTYDRMDNKLTEEKLHNTDNSEVYSYDSAYRLTDFDRPNTGSIDPSHSDWQLDGVGNWQEVLSTESGAPVQEAREHSSFNEITARRDGGATDIFFDDNGNETDDGTFAYQWDFNNRLRAVTRNADSAPIAAYNYDAAGRRTRKTVTNSDARNGITEFYFDDWQVVEERNDADELEQQYVFGIYIDEPLALDHNLDGDDTSLGLGDQRLFYHQSTLHSVFALVDMSGAIAEGYQYDAFGHPTVYEPGPNGAVDFGGDDVVMFEGMSAAGNPYLFTGRRHDGETGWYYYRTRYLDPAAGRFSSRDTIGIWGDPISVGNGYAYVGNSPANETDAMGTQVEAAETYCARKNERDPNTKGEARWRWSIGKAIRTALPNCLRVCIEEHELSHVEDFNKYNICNKDGKFNQNWRTDADTKTMKDLGQKINGNPTFAEYTECKAYTRSLDCLLECPCEDDLGDTIAQWMKAQRLYCNYQGFGPKTPRY